MHHWKNALFSMVIVVLFIWIPTTASGVSPGDELQEVKDRLDAVEQKIQQQEEQQSKTEETVSGITDALSIGGGITGIVQGTIQNKNNYPPGERGEEVQDGSFSVDLEVSAPLNDTAEAFLLIEAGDGEGVTSEVTTFFGVNDDALDDDASMSVSEAWYEHRSDDETGAFTMGKLDLTNYFDGNAVANDETTQFLSSGLVNNITIEFPDYGAGARLTMGGDTVYLTLGWGEADSDWEDVFDDGFGIAEIGCTPAFGDDDLEGAYRIIGWINGADHTEILDTGTNRAKTRKDNSGYAVSLDQQVTEDLTLFGRFGAQDEDVAEVAYSWSTGFQIQRDDNVFAAAYGQALLGKDYRDLLRANGIKPDDEEFLEAYYSIAVNELLAISPDVQVIWNGGGDSDNHTVTVLGVRGQVSF